MVEKDPVAAKQLASPAHRLAHPRCTERLGQGGLLVFQLPGILDLRQAHHHALRSRDVPQHPDEQVLNELKPGNRASKLLALAGVAKRMLISALCTAHRLP